MTFDVLERRGVVVVVSDEKGPHKTVEAASAAGDKLVATAVKANLAEQDAMDADVEAASAGEKDTYLADLKREGSEYVVDKYPKARSVEEAKARGIPFSGNELTVIDRILKDMEAKGELK